MNKQKIGRIQPISNEEKLSLLESFIYKDGIVYRKNRTHGCKFNQPVGFVNGNGYCRVEHNKRRYYIHRVVYLLHHGVWPEMEIDHINGIRSDNRIENLRIATQEQQNMNSAVRSDNRSGVVGVCKRSDNKFDAYITVYGKLIYLGRYGKIETATKVRLEAEKKYYGDYSARVCR